MVDNLDKFDKKLLVGGTFLWTQRVLNHACRIITDCDSEKKIREFFEECEKKLRAPETQCRGIWNTEVSRFGGDEFSYVVYFSSEILNATIKTAIDFNPLTQVITIGHMEIASKREERKLEKHLNTTLPNTNGDKKNEN